MKKANKKRLIFYYKLLTSIGFLVFLGVFIILGFSIIPIPGNYKIYTVLTGSMNPTIKTGSIVFIKPQKNYQLKNIVTFFTSTPKQTTTHRIVGVKTINHQQVFITKGDANKSDDFKNLPFQNILGKVVFSIPFLGYLISFSKTFTGLIILIVIPATIIIYSEIINIKNEVIRLVKKRRIKKT